jgi:carboxypeptidase PM20D1
VYRFAPYRLRPDDVSRLHGTNERIAIKDYAEMIRFYVTLLKGQ